MNKLEVLEELIIIKNKWEKTGLLERLEFKDQLILSQLLERGSKVLVELSNGIYNDIEEFHKFKSYEDLAGLFLPAISRKYRKNLKVFDLEDLILDLNRNANLYYELEEFTKKRSLKIDCEDQFLNAVI